MRSLRAPLIIAIAAACGAGSAAGPGAGPALTVGTWGGDQAGVIVTDTGVHVHIGCTLGDIAGTVAIDDHGVFDKSGSYLLRAYPIAVGPTMPAQFHGVITRTLVGGKWLAQMTLTVTVNDTVQKQTVVKGPATVTFGATPQMGPCPICSRPGERMIRRSP